MTTNYNDLFCSIAASLEQNHDDDVQHFVQNNLYNVPYGKEDEIIVRYLTTRRKQFFDNITTTADVLEQVKQLSWHALFRIWLRTTTIAASADTATTTTTAIQESNNHGHTTTSTSTSILQLILIKLQECLLYHNDSSLSVLVWDDDTDDDDDTTLCYNSWKDDGFVQNWNVMSRPLVMDDIRRIMDGRVVQFQRQDQHVLQRILDGIDQLVEYRRCCNDETVHNNEYNNKTTATTTTTPAPRVNVIQNYFATPTDPSSDQTTRSSFQQRQQRQQNATDMIRQLWIPVPTILSSTLTSKSDIPSIVETYLLGNGTDDDNDSNNGDNNIPDVRNLALILWDMYLYGQRGHHHDDDDVDDDHHLLETVFRKFASWLPIQPLTLRYKSLLRTTMTMTIVKSDDDGTAERKKNGIMQIQKVRITLLRATDVLCVLIGNNAVDEWKHVWDDDDDEFVTSTRVSLVHAVVLDSSRHKTDERYATVVAVLDRLVQNNDTRDLVSACPQLGWMSFLFGNVPTTDKGRHGDVPAQRSCDGEDMKRIHKCLNVAEEDVCLPPLPLYIESVLSACTLPHTEPTRNVWMEHVVETLTLFKQSDEVAVEWFRCLSKVKTLHPMTEALHRRVCLDLWEPDAVRSSTCVSTLLTESRQNHILSCTPPRCLFADASGLESKLEHLLLAFGKVNSCLEVVAIGLALAIDCDSSGAMKCRDVLYQYLRPLVIKADTRLFEAVNRSLSAHPAGLQWWNRLYEDLVRNEIPLFMAIEEVVSFEVSDIDEFPVSRKRPREEVEEETVEQTIEEPSSDLQSGSRRRESAATVIRNLYSNIKHSKESCESIEGWTESPGGSDFLVMEEKKEMDCSDDSEDYNDEDDEQILLL